MQSFWKSFTKTLGILTAFFVILLLILIVPRISDKYMDLSQGKYEFIEGDKSSLNKIIILQINGLITNQSKIDLPLLNSKIIYANEVEKIPCFKPSSSKEIPVVNSLSAFKVSPLE